MIVGKINLDKVDQSKVFQGQKGKYVDIVLIETPDDKFGNDYVIKQGLSKKDREAGVKGAILGNATKYKSNNKQLPPEREAGRTGGGNHEPPF